jgi:rod shape-determining protein MreC
MRNLLSFLKRFRNFLIFIVLQIFILSLFFNSKNYHKASFVNSTNAISGWIIQKRYNITKHFNLSEVNEQLAQENAELKSKLPFSFYTLENNVFSVNDTLFEQQYQYISATVLNYTNHMHNNYATIDKGTLAGIEKDMGVIVNNGIVGFVIDVSDHYAIVRTVLSERINLIVEVNGIMGQLDWRGTDKEFCHIKGLTASADIKKGDKVFTKGSSGHFPKGILVGVVADIEVENGSATLTVPVKLSTNFSALSHVYVVVNIFKQEQKELEGAHYE